MKKVIAGCIDLMLEFDSASELEIVTLLILRQRNRNTALLTARNYRVTES